MQIEFDDKRLSQDLLQLATVTGRSIPQLLERFTKDALWGWDAAERRLASQMQVPAELAAKLEDFSARTGFTSDVFLTEAINDWFAVCADTYIENADKRRRVAVMPLRPRALES